MRTKQEREILSSHTLWLIRPNVQTVDQRRATYVHHSPSRSLLGGQDKQVQRPKWRDQTPFSVSLKFFQGTLLQTLPIYSKLILLSSKQGTPSKLWCVNKKQSFSLFCITCFLIWLNSTIPTSTPISIFTGLENSKCGGWINRYYSWAYLARYTLICLVEYLLRDIIAKIYMLIVIDIDNTFLL